jgi:hypothetical protein
VHLDLTFDLDLPDIPDRARFRTHLAADLELDPARRGAPRARRAAAVGERGGSAGRIRATTGGGAARSTRRGGFCSRRAARGAAALRRSRARGEPPLVAARARGDPRVRPRSVRASGAVASRNPRAHPPVHFRLDWAKARRSTPSSTARSLAFRRARAPGPMSRLSCKRLDG